MSGQVSAPLARPLARAATARDFERLLAHPDRQRFGWGVEYDGDVLVTVTLRAKRTEGAEGQEDIFVITLDCDSYDVWPPEVKFVNPKTRTYLAGQDLQHLPRIEGFPNFQIHPTYAHFLNPPGRVDQLVCFSFTRGYYDTSHHPQPHERWKQGRHWLYSTVKVLHRALQPPFYKGRIG